MGLPPPATPYGLKPLSDFRGAKVPGTAGPLLRTSLRSSQSAATAFTNTSGNVDIFRTMDCLNLIFEFLAVRLSWNDYICMSALDFCCGA